MMFPHTITIYRHSVENNADVYRLQTVSGVYWYGSDTVTVSGNGIQAAHPVTVVSSPDLAATFGTDWDVKPGDRIVRGTGIEISSWKELADCVTVKKVDDNRCGGRVDNITIGCE